MTGGTVALRRQPRREGWWRPVVATVLIVIDGRARTAVRGRPVGPRHGVGHRPLRRDGRSARHGPGRPGRDHRSDHDRDRDPAPGRRRHRTRPSTRSPNAACRRWPPRVSRRSRRRSPTPSTASWRSRSRALVESDQFETAWDRGQPPGAHPDGGGADRQGHRPGRDHRQRGQRQPRARSSTRSSSDWSTRGFTLAERLPAVDAQFTIFQSDDITKAQTAFRLLGALNTWLPILALLLPRRRGRRRADPPP